MQGDIQSVYDSFGNQVLTYTYDAWGNVNATVNSDSLQGAVSASMAAEFIPITYRGYMYDFNTGLYYLQSRYYNPTYGRFLNADTTEILEATQGTPLGANLFAYCNNNPVNMVDYGGRSATLIVAIVLLIIGVFLSSCLLTWLDLIPDFMLEWKMTKIIRNNPKLEKLVDIWSNVDDVSGFITKYWYVYSIFLAHAKNIVDYCNNPNLDYEYPKFNELVGTGISYKNTLETASQIVKQWNYFGLGKNWTDMGPEGQFKFVHYMYAYDTLVYDRFFMYSLDYLRKWGAEEAENFFVALLEILVRNVSI